MRARLSTRPAADVVADAVCIRPSVPGELSAALRHRAALDDHVVRRREAAVDGLHAAVAPVFPDVPATSTELLELVVAKADELAVSHGQVLADVVAWLAGTDLPEPPDAAAQDRETFEQSSTRQPEQAPSITTDELFACMHRHDPEVVGIRDLRRLTGGFSKETLSAVVEREGDHEPIVIRKVNPGRTADTLPGEFAAQYFAWRGGVAAPEPLCLDESALGAPAFAMRMSPGTCPGDVWGPLEHVEPGAALAAARNLATLHTLDPATLVATPLPPMTTRTEIVDAIDERRRVVDTVSTDPVEPYAALFRLLLAWLRAHAPGDVPRPVLVHGDFGLHNLLVDGSGLTAVLDWERAHLGHPAEDLAYLRPSIESVVDWPTFLDAYLDAGGPAPEPERMAFYAVWHDIWRGVSALRLRAKFLAEPTELGDALVGMLMTPRFLTRAAAQAFPPA